MDRTANEFFKDINDLSNQAGIGPGSPDVSFNADHVQADMSSEIPSANEMAEFAQDPYVASDDSQAGSFSPLPKSIEEILKNISGYQEDLVENEITFATSAQPTGQELDNATGDQFDDTSSPTLTSDNTVAEVLTSQEGEIDIDLVSQNQPAGVQVEIVQTVERGGSSAEAFADNSIDEAIQLEQLEFDVRNFEEPNGAEEKQPAPIRGGFELDQDHFDYVAPELGEVAAPTQVASTESERAAQSDNLFYADAGDVIYVDGKEGFGHIDLACFDVSDATFQGNEIQIACEDGTSFQIDYRNVTHALFADGVEIELSANEPDFDPEA